MRSIESFLAEHDRSEAEHERFLGWCESAGRDPQDPVARAEWDRSGDLDLVDAAYPDETHLRGVGDGVPRDLETTEPTVQPAVEPGTGAAEGTGDRPSWRWPRAAGW